MNQELKISHSSEIKDLVASLAKAQGAMKPAVFNKKNPHFKSRYADFASCMDACRTPLSENGIAVIQTCSTIDGKLNLVTMIAHTSGQWMKSEFPIVASKMDSQGIGSAMTYAKRYSLCGMVGIVADEDLNGDDDGESAVGRGRQEEEPVRQPPRPNIQLKQQKILPAQLSKIKQIEEKLDKECKDKLYAWLFSAYQIDKIEDVIVENYQKVLGAFENALKFMEQNKLEAVHA